MLAQAHEFAFSLDITSRTSDDSSYNQLSQTEWSCLQDNSNQCSTACRENGTATTEDVSEESAGESTECTSNFIDCYDRA